MLGIVELLSFQFTSLRLCPSSASCSPPSTPSIVVCLILSCFSWFPPLLCHPVTLCLVIICMDKARIQYKIACLCFQCLSHNTMPPYLSDLLHPYQPPRTLRSLDTSLLSVPRFCLETFGRRSFSVFGPTVWNSLPLSLRKTQCFSTFKKKLKTHLFEKHLS